MSAPPGTFENVSAPTSIAPGEGTIISKLALFKKGMESGAVQLKKQGVKPPPALEIDIGASLMSADEDEGEKSPEIRRKEKMKYDKMVKKVKERIQIREDRERRAWIDQKTFSAKERFNFDKYDQSISRILIRSQPKFIQHKYRIKSMDEIKEQKEKEERKQTALDYAKKELAKREREVNPRGLNKVERLCNQHHAIEIEF